MIKIFNKCVLWKVIHATFQKLFCIRRSIANDWVKFTRGKLTHESSVFNFFFFCNLLTNIKGYYRIEYHKRQVPKSILNKQTSTSNYIHYINVKFQIQITHTKLKFKIEPLHKCHVPNTYYTYKIPNTYYILKLQNVIPPSSKLQQHSFKDLNSIA